MQNSSEELFCVLVFFLEGQSAGGAREGGGQRPALLQDNRGQNGCGEEGARDAPRLGQQGARSHPASGSGRGPDTAQVSDGVL